MALLVPRLITHKSKGCARYRNGDCERRYLLFSQVFTEIPLILKRWACLTRSRKTGKAEQEHSPFFDNRLRVKRAGFRGRRMSQEAPICLRSSSDTLGRLSGLRARTVSHFCEIAYTGLPAGDPAASSAPGVSLLTVQPAPPWVAEGGNQARSSPICPRQAGSTGGRIGSYRCRLLQGLENAVLRQQLG